MSKKIPKNAITEQALRKLLQKAIGPESTGTAWAKDNDITPQQVSAFDRKVQGPGQKIPAALGYKAAIIYIPIDSEDIHVKPPKREPVGPTKDQIMAEEAKAAKKKKKKDKKKKRK